MKNNELKTKSIRLVAYRPLELEMLIQREDSYGLDKEMLSSVLTRVKDFPYSYELCALWAVYKIDNLIEPLFFIHVDGINSKNVIDINLFNNSNRTINLEETEVNDAIKCLIGYLQDFEINNIIIHKDGEISNLIKSKKNKKEDEAITYKYNGFLVRLISAIIDPFAFGFVLFDLIFIAFLNEEVLYSLIDLPIISYFIGIQFCIIMIIILLFLFVFPVIHFINILKKKKRKLMGLLIALDAISLIINIFIMYVLLNLN